MDSSMVLNNEDTQRTVSLPYEIGQWSPFNKNGKKVYSKKFLICLRNDPKSNIKPKNIPAALEVNYKNKNTFEKSTIPPVPKSDRTEAASVIQQPLLIQGTGNMCNNPQQPAPIRTPPRNRYVGAPLMSNRTLQAPIRTPPHNQYVVASLMSNRTPQGSVAFQTPIFTPLPFQPNQHYGNIFSWIGQPIQYFRSDPYIPPGSARHPTRYNTYRYSEPAIIRENLLQKCEASSPSVPILEEYLNNTISIQEVQQKINTTIVRFARQELIINGYFSVLQTSKKIRLQTGYLFGKLIKLGSFSVEDYCLGLDIVMKTTDNLITDDPNIWDYIAELVFPVLCEGATETNNLYKMFNLLVKNIYLAKLLTRIFQLMISENEESNNLTFADYTNAAKVQPRTSLSVEQTSEQREIQLNKLLDDYLDNRCTLKDCVELIKTSITFNETPQLVSLGSIKVLKKSKKSRLQTGVLFAELIQLNILSVPNYCVGLEVFLKKAEQLVTEIPEVWNFVAEIVSPVIVRNAVTLTDLHNSFKLLINSNKYAPKLLNCLFKLIIQDHGNRFLQNIWKYSNLTFTDFMDKSQVANFVKQNHFEFLLKTDDSSSSHGNCIPFNVQNNTIKNKTAIAKDSIQVPGNGGHSFLNNLQPIAKTENVSLKNDTRPSLKLIKNKEENKNQAQATTNILSGPALDQLRNILEEYLNDNCTVQECNFFLSHSMLSQFVSDSYIRALERSKAVRLRIGYLFAQLLKLGTFSTQDYCAGLEIVLKNFADLITYVPKVSDSVAELIYPVICENSVTLEDLRISFELVLSKKCFSKLLGSLFRFIEQEKGLFFLQSSWKRSAFTVDDYTAKSQVVGTCINEYKFKHLLNEASPPNEQIHLSYKEIYVKLLEFFKAGTSSNDIKIWIYKNVGGRVKDSQFIRTLAAACFEDSVINLKLDVDILQRKYSLLHTFINNTPAYELQCLYALQAFIDKLQHPPGLAVVICNRLYCERVVSHKSFLIWETNNDPAEQQGKAKIITYLTSFFAELNEFGGNCSSASED